MGEQGLSSTKAIIFLIGSRSKQEQKVISLPPFAEPMGVKRVLEEADLVIVNMRSQNLSDSGELENPSSH